MNKLIIYLIILFLLSNMLSITAFSEELTGEEIVEFAIKYEGYRYRYGGSSPKGFDCSGFVYYVYNNFGYNVGRTSTSQYNSGKHIKLENLEVGDIVIFKNTYERGISHSGIYIGNNKFIHAANSRQGIVITNLYDNYYKSRFVTGIRVICKSCKDSDINLLLVEKIKKIIKFNIEILMK